MKIELICSYSPQYNLLQEDVTAYDGEAESTTTVESTTTKETCADDSDRQPWTKTKTIQLNGVSR